MVSKMLKNKRSRGLKSRGKATRQQKKLYIIVGEGERTEKEYFQIFRDLDNAEYFVRYISPASHHGGDTRALVAEIESEERERPISSVEAPTEYWIVADVENEGSGRNFDPLFKWVGRNQNRHLALTNPQFENWLLLHFQKSIASSNPVKELNKYITTYTLHSKGIERKVTLEHVKTALNNAKSANVVATDNPQTMGDIPINHTAVPKLVEKLVVQSWL